MTQKETQPHGVDSYKHDDAERVNVIAAGVAPFYAHDSGDAAHYAFDANIDPRLEWSGKAEKSDLYVPIAGVHTHERMTAERVVRQLLADEVNYANSQGVLFESDAVRTKHQKEALEAYQHPESWTNRLIAGDSLLVMTSLLRKEAMAGKVQCVYMDPPYGISYGSNFQAFTGKRDVKDKKDEDLPYQPEMVKAFRDTWELGIHSYLTYIRERLLVARELLNDSGSCFVQIGDENVHLVRCVMDEVFGRGNCVGQISFRKKTMPLGAKFVEQMHDFILFYAKDISKLKFRHLYREYKPEVSSDWKWVELPDGTRRQMTKEEISNFSLLPKGARVYRLKAPSPLGENIRNKYVFEFDGVKYQPPQNGWGLSEEKLNNLVKANRVQVKGNVPNYILFLDDFPVTKITNPWNDTVGAQKRVYAVQTDTLPIQRCLLMTTDPGDLVLDPTCGSGTTAFVAEQWGRRWITCDTSRVALTLAEKRLVTATFDWYVLNKDGVVSSGFKYKTVPHVTLKSIANGEEAASEVLYDKPEVDKKRVRVAGPFTVEALPAPLGAQAEVAPLVLPGEGDSTPRDAQRDAEQSEAGEWCRELKRSGVLARGGERLMFNRVELSDAYEGFQAEAETADGRSAAVMFAGARYTMDAGRVSKALLAAQNFSPMPRVLLFAAFEFSAEAEKYITDNAPRWERRSVALLHTLMNNDLLTKDLRKGNSDSMSFFMVGQPDVVLRKVPVIARERSDRSNLVAQEIASQATLLSTIAMTKKGEIATAARNDGDACDMYQVEVRGFDYFSVAKGQVISGGTDKIAMWMLDTDYDGLVINPAQVFFPMDGDSAWRGVARALRAEVDAERMKAFKGCVSLPFKMRNTEDARVAVKIVDDRGIESMRVLGRKD